MNRYLTEIENKKVFNFDETFKLYKICAQAVNDNSEKAQKLLVNILDNREKFDTSLDEVLADLLESIGFYPYLVKENLELSSTASIMRQEYHHSDNLNKYLHEDQKFLLSLINSDKNVIVSAPTSFGKSLLIEEFVASKIFRNIIIIQPTLALLDETRRKLQKYDEHYKLIVRTSQEPSITKGNIFLFTAERVNEYREFNNIDFIVVDEFYKLSSNRDDERADSLNNALYYILKKYKPKFYLLGPNIDGISDGFEDKYNAIFYKTKTSLVDVKTIDVYSDHKKKFDQPRKFKEYKQRVLFDLLFENSDQQTIIYCSSPSKVRKLSRDFLIYLQEKNIEISNNDLDIIEWIEKNISPQWSLIPLLKHGVGIHDGGLQKHITTSVIDYFNEGLLSYLFCTTTIIEGVNTSAKNIVFFDNKKGRNIPIDYFDYSNIKGRAGRLMVHYTGVIYNFNSIPANEKIIIDIPFHEQNPISPEVLINLEELEIIDKESNDYKIIRMLTQEEKRVIQSNGVNIFGQRDIIEQLREDVSSSKYALVVWDGFPTYEQLEYIFTLAKKYLLKPTESFRPMTIKKLTYITLSYSINKNLNELIKSQIKFNVEENKMSEKDALEEAIRECFQILKHWFQYKIPKWLSVMNSLQEFVCEEKKLRAGNYSYFANLIESDFIREDLSILSEYGVPSSAIRKLEGIISQSKDADSVLSIIKRKEILENPIFIDYERNKLKIN
ncbi:DEAD/DEAH box helicase [Psychrobacter sp. T6-6]|uniref:DEAD/DEAH box helicase n=1 Tax=Psychrobacter sp. T6-6 TaxID=3457452 RepID=UPI003FD5F20B